MKSTECMLRDVEQKCVRSVRSNLYKTKRKDKKKEKKKQTNKQINQMSEEGRPSSSDGKVTRQNFRHNFSDIHGIIFNKQERKSKSITQIIINKGTNLKSPCTMKSLKSFVASFVIVFR